MHTSDKGQTSHLQLPFGTLSDSIEHYYQIILKLFKKYFKRIMENSKLKL